MDLTTIKTNQKLNTKQIDKIHLVGWQMQVQ